MSTGKREAWRGGENSVLYLPTLGQAAQFDQRRIQINQTDRANTATSALGYKTFE